MATLKQSLAVTRSKLDSLVLKAPVAGKLTENDLQVGQIVKPGDRLGEMVPATGFKALADIDEYYLGRVAIGQTADVTLDGQSYPMVVTRVEPAGEGLRPSRSSSPSRARSRPACCRARRWRASWRWAATGARWCCRPARSWSAPAATG